jgi:hypothetical protein
MQDIVLKILVEPQQVDGRYVRPKRGRWVELVDFC